MPTHECTVPEDATKLAKWMANKGARPGLIAEVEKETFGISMMRCQVARATVLK